MKLNKTKLFCICIIILIISVNSLLAQLKEIDNQADYLVIAPSYFVETLYPFIEWRQTKGLAVKVVELNQIYSEFPDSIKSSSIRKFVSYSLTYWVEPKPEYLLLVGGTALIPSNKVESRLAGYPLHLEDSVSIDDWYSVNLYESDIDPDIFLGRFPANNEQELINIINKTIHFEDSLSFNDYQTNFVFLTDKTDSSGFEGVANDFINYYLPENFSMKTIFAGQNPTIEYTRNELANTLNDGTLFFSYYGHGAPYQWSKYNIFNVQDIDSLVQNNRPFIFTAAACSQNFDMPYDSSIVRKLILSNHCGTVASVASSGLTFLGFGADFLSKFYDILFDNPDITIGNAIFQTKLFLPYDNAVDAFQRRYTLLGDPALKIPIEIINQIIAQTIIIPNEYFLEQNYPNPFNSETTINYSISKSGFVTLKVYNLLGQEVSTLVSEEKIVGSYKRNFNGINLSSGIYFYHLRVNDFSAVKKFVLTK